MSGTTDEDILDLLGPEPEAIEIEPIDALVDAIPRSKPAGRPTQELLARSASYSVKAKVPRKNTPERLNRLLSYIAEMPVAADATRRVGINMRTLQYWLQKSLEGRPGDGFDIEMGENDETDNPDNTVRFHLAWESAMEVGVGKVEEATHRRATGFWEPLTYQGKVQYQMDWDKVAAAQLMFVEGDRDPLTDPANYLLDEYGAPVPERVWKMDPDLAMFILKTRKPQIYGAKAQIDVNVKGGVLVIPMRAVTSEALNEIEAEYRREGAPEVTFEDAPEDEEDAA